MLILLKMQLRKEVMLNQSQSDVYCSLSKTKWITQEELINILEQKFNRKYKPRKLRAIIKECRLLYKENILDLLIIKSNRGYKLSNDLNEIDCFTQELIHCGESMITEGKEIYHAAREKNNQNEKIVCDSIEEYCKDAIEEMINKECFSLLQLQEINEAISRRLSYSSIFLFAKKEYHPFIMKLIRECIENSVNIEELEKLLNKNLTLLSRAYELEKLRKEKRDV